MNRNIELLFISILLVIVQLTNAQLDPNRLIPADEKFLMPIYDVQPDRTGNIWLATQNGLQKYDGYELTRFYPDPNDSTTTAEVLTYSLFEEVDATLWIGCEGYITAYHPSSKSFTNYNFGNLVDFPGLRQPAVIDIVDDQRGRIYFGVRSFNSAPGTKALLYFDKAEKQLHSFEAPAGDSIMNVVGMVADKDNNIWVNTWNGLFMIDTLHNFHRLPYPFEQNDNDWISNLGTNDRGEILMPASHARFLLYDPKSDQYTKFKIPGIAETPDNLFQVLNMLTDSLDNTWIGSNYGLFYFNRVEESFESFSDLDAMKDDIYGLQLDAFGDLWISTYSKGLFRYSNKTILQSFANDNADKQSITSGWVNRIYENEDGTVWVYTRGNIEEAGLNLFDPVTNSIKPYPNHTFLPNIEWNDLIDMPGPNEFLFNTNLGYFKCKPLNGTMVKMDLSGAPWDYQIFKVFRDSRGNTLYGTSEGLFIKYKEEKFKHYILSDLPGANATSNEIYQIFESAKGGLWLGSNNGLFYYHYDSDSIERVAHDPALGDVLRSQDINSFYEDRTGIAWIGTWQGGLSKYDPETRQVRNYTMNDGLPSMAIQGIIGDDERKVLWLSTFDGISMFDKESESFKNYSLEDGIQATLYADGAHLKTRSGTGIFGANNGISYFDLAEVSKKSNPPMVFINNFKVEENSYAEYLESPFSINDQDKKELELNHDQNTISIDYTGIHYANPSKNKFAYILENYDNDWRQVNNTRTAYYYSLPSGKYTFKVKAANSNGVWSEQAASFDFKIKRPWWHSWWAYAVYGIILILLLLFLDRYQKRRLLERERRLTREKELLHAREIEKAYKELKDTQKQLIHSEKMASLGELTAGIAHEIQNPLNFVNNFSEVSVDLVEDLNDEVENGDKEEVKALANDLKQNLEKIFHHGKRASGIVRGMLEHSRTGSGEKILTDINALADEFLRLAYHGLRAKDKSFNANFSLDADPNLPKVNLVSQDVGRVLLNLVNNAFHAVNERSRQGIDGYQAEVTVSTKLNEDKLEIRVKDNGNGIPDEIKDKIFQPFFTTKPTGEGTGLGLSLSYDIIQAHGGSLSLNEKLENGTEFIIYLPITV